MKTTCILAMLLTLLACKEELPEPVKTYISTPRSGMADIAVDTAEMVAVSKPIVKPVIDTVQWKDDDVFIILPPVSARESFNVLVNDQGETKKVKVKYEIGKDSLREYAQIYNNLDIRFFPEIPLKLDARVESYISRYRTMNTSKIMPLKPIITGNLFSFNLEKLQDDKVFNLVIYEAGRKVHSISFEKYLHKL